LKRPLDCKYFSTAQISALAKSMDAITILRNGRLLFIANPEENNPKFRHRNANSLGQGNAQARKAQRQFYLLRPGPRNPVGVMWIALNKKGIGIHGTDDPASIGHAASHGCIRLANWDVVRLATKIKPGDNVSIH
jgi:hypothetical protein